MGFRDLGFSLFEGRDSGFYCKMGSRLRIKSMHWMRDAGRGMLKIAIGITGWRENLCLDDGIKEPDHAKNSVLT